MKVEHAINKIASGAVTKNFIAKLTSDTQAALASAATDKLMGVFLNDAADTEYVDVQTAGTAEVKAGGTVNVGDPVTSDANGKAVASAPAGGSNNRIVGFALVGAVSGDIFPIRLALGSLQG